MIRTAIATAAALFVFVGGLNAAEIKGKLVKVDAEKNTITMLVGATKTEKGEEKTFKVAKAAKFASVKTVKKEKQEESLTEGIKHDLFAKAGGHITLTTTGEGDKEEATEVKINIGGKKKNQ